VPEDVTRPAPLISSEGTTGREEWALDPGKRHINHGSYGAVPRRTLAFQDALKTELEANPLRWFDGLPDRLAVERGALAPFVGAAAHEIAVIPNASAGASVMFGSLRLSEGDEILVTDHIYGAVLMGAQRFAERWGATVRVVPVPLEAGEAATLALIAEAVTSRTRVLIVDHISSATARAFPVAAIVALAEGRGIVTLVDGAHAAGILDAAAHVVDGASSAVWFGNLHKFPSAPRGSAVLVARGELAAGLFPLVDSWGATLPYPERFDQQGSNDITGFLSASNGIAEIERLFGWQRVRDHAAQLGAYAVSIIAPALGEWVDEPIVELGMPEPLQPLLRLPPGVAVDGDGQRALKNALSAEADIEAGIMPWNGAGYLRLSAHAYSEPDDYEQFVERGIPVIARIAAERSRAR
jgi:isopenicillin-N epimerase